MNLFMLVRGFNIKQLSEVVRRIDRSLTGLRWRHLSGQLLDRLEISPLGLDATIAHAFCIARVTEPSGRCLASYSHQALAAGCVWPSSHIQTVCLCSRPNWRHSTGRAAMVSSKQRVFAMRKRSSSCHRQSRHWFSAATNYPCSNHQCVDQHQSSFNAATISREQRRGDC